MPSVKAGADALRAVQRNWSLYAAAHHRRAALIAARLPPVAARPLVFPCAAPTSHLGAWTLLAPQRMLASATKSSPFANGECRFVEDRTGPPSRAYLKLWEALTRLGEWPHPGERCLDLGAAPGGWTWAVARLGAAVTAVDKAPLAPGVAAMPGVTWRAGSAFALAPEPVDWLFSDVVAYPRRMLALVERWVASRCRAADRLHGEVPGRHRPRRRRGVRRHSGRQAGAPVPQQARADLDVARRSRRLTAHGAACRAISRRRLPGATKRSASVRGRACSTPKASTARLANGPSGRCRPRPI